MNWLANLKLDHREQRIAFEEMLLAVRQARERIERLEQAMREAVADWTLAPVVEALQAMRGMDMIGAIIFLAELGDLSRFENPRQVMAYLGLTASERSTGDSVRRGGITKAGNSRAPAVDRSRLELPVPSARQQRHAGEDRRRATGSARDCLEGPDATLRALSDADPAGKTAGDRGCRNRPRIVRLPLGDQPRDS